MITHVDYDFGPSARNRLDDATNPGRDGADAALETFYHALNNADLGALSAVWSDHQLAQLNNPVGKIIRSGAAVTDLYRRVFASGVDVQVTFTDAVTYSAAPTARSPPPRLDRWRSPAASGQLVSTAALIPRLTP